jgi:hypothetical protein
MACRAAPARPNWLVPRRIARVLADQQAGQAGLQLVLEGRLDDRLDDDGGTVRLAPSDNPVVGLDAHQGGVRTAVVSDLSRAVEGEGADGGDAHGRSRKGRGTWSPDINRARGQCPWHDAPPPRTL